MYVTLPRFLPIKLEAFAVMLFLLLSLLDRTPNSETPLVCFGLTIEFAESWYSFGSLGESGMPWP